MCCDSLELFDFCVVLSLLFAHGLCSLFCSIPAIAKREGRVLAWECPFQVIFDLFDQKCAWFPVLFTLAGLFGCPYWTLAAREFHVDSQMSLRIKRVPLYMIQENHSEHIQIHFQTPINRNATDCHNSST